MTIIPANELTTEEVIQQALKQSVQKPPEVSKEGGVNQMSLAGWRGSFLPAYGTRQREFALRDWYRMDEQVLVRGAFTGLAKHIGNLPWEITGDDTPSEIFTGMGLELGYSNTDTGVEYFQAVLRHANFGAGWGQLMTQVVLDFLRYDAGAFIEVIGGGDSYSELTGAITGIAHLDPLRCIPTGDPRYPCIYYDRRGGLHVMHFTRVIMLQDMNDGDEWRPGYGDSALSRAISIAAREMWITRYINAYLDDEAAPGLDIFGGITKGMFDEAESKFRQQQQMDSKPIWGKRMRFFTAGANVMPKIESVQWQTSPEKFDFRVYTDIDVDVLALAINVDRQELMPLMSGNMGSEAQSIILHQKSKGKTLGFLMTEIERRFNDILPDGFEYSFKVRDDQEAKSQADKAAVWGGFTQQTKHLFDAKEQREIVASQVEAVQDALDNQTRLNDVDIAPVASANDTGDAVDNTGAGMPLIAGVVDLYKQQLDAGVISLGQYQKMTGQKVTPGFDDLYMFGGLPVPADEVPNLWKYKQTIAPSVYNSELITGEPLPQPVDPTQVIPDGAPGSVGAQPLDENEPAAAPANDGFKSYASTEADFIENVRDLLKSAVEGDGYLDKRGFSVTLRSLLKRYGLLAFKDGMRQGGVSVNELDPEDQEFYQEAFLYQAGYIPSFADEVFGKGVTPAAIDTRARMWGKSLQKFVDRGRVSADGNGMYEWVFGKTEVHCDDCLRLNGQVHRMKHWWNSGWTPRTSKLACGGWLCDCGLKKTDKSAAGAY